jgi:16S rRNA (cytosine1402-N4)-methyltransferase
VSVLLAEVLAAFEGRPVRRYVDGTLGAAGHACAVLRQHPEMQALVGFDLDPTAHQLASAKLQQCGAALVPVAVSPAGAASFDAAAAAGGQQQQQPTAFLVRSNFGRMKAVLQQLPLGADGAPAGGSSSSSGGGVDAILLDLGISSMQVGAGYGFAHPAASDISAPGLHSTLLPRSLPSPAAP